MKKAHRIILILLTWHLVSSCDQVTAQSSLNSNVRIDQNAIELVNKNRLKFLTITGASIYSIGSIGLYHTWYKKYPSSGFHFFDDYGEWSNMDKLGHSYSAYAQTNLIYKGMKWTGLDNNRSILIGAASATLFQTTIEVMDGFSSEWGFSWSDFGANIVGVGSFALQQKYWHEQRLRLKFSAVINQYGRTKDISGNEINLESRASDLYGSGLEAILKDYNAQTIWLSGNINSFYPKSNLPKWLNIAFGYGVENLYGGFENTWIDDQNDQPIILSEPNDKRYIQFYLSLDVDLSKIDTNSKFLRTFLDVLNVIKIPFSAIEFNTLGELKFKIIHF